MTAMPQQPVRLRGETRRAAIETVREEAALRTLPPTLFRLRDLNPPPASSTPVQRRDDGGGLAGQHLRDDLSQEQDDLFHDRGYGPHVEAPGQPIQRHTSPPTPPLQPLDASPSNTFSWITHVSSQYLVFFVILAIAVTGIVVGNRGENRPHEVVDVEEPSVADFAIDEGIAGDIPEPHVGASAEHDEVPDDQSHREAYADLGATEPTEPLMQSTEDDLLSGFGTDPAVSGADSAIASIAPPQTNSSIGASTSNTGENVINQPSETAPADPLAGVAVPASLASSSPKLDSALVTGSATSAPQPTSPASAPQTQHNQTATPLGVVDWSRYLPPIESASPGQPTSAGATPSVPKTATPFDPMQSYQRYLQSGAPSSGESLADPYSDPSYTDSQLMGTQAQVPNLTTPTQRR